MNKFFLEAAPVYLPWLSFLATAIFGAATLWVACLVYGINKNKLQLDLFEKRFEVYRKTSAYLHHYNLTIIRTHPAYAELAATTGWGPLTSADVWQHKLLDFYEACDEALFLFPPKSGVHAHLVKLGDAATEGIDKPELLAEDWMQELANLMVKYMQF